MFAIEMEFLTGVCVAATPYSREEPEWPPHPDRLFQALVAAWGRNEKPLDDEQAALKWLERLDNEGLVLSAPSAHQRDVVPVFVPPNDARTTKDPKKSIRVIPELRQNRNPRRFPAVVPAAERPVVCYIWKRADGLDQHRAALVRLAREVTYLGHPHTLVRVALLDGEAGVDHCDSGWMRGSPAELRVPYEGRLQHLIEQHQGGDHPNSSLALRRFTPPAGSAPPHTMFDPAAIVLADGGGFVPALDAFPLVAKRLRDALLKTADDEGLHIPTLLSGHNPDGSPAERPHLAIAPLADVGWRYSQGRLMGIVLIWPRHAAAEERAAALRALAAFLREGDGLHFGQLGSWRLTPMVSTHPNSLHFERYVEPSGRWATVLPVVLDRYPKNKAGRDLATIVQQACLNVGLPQEVADGLSIEVHSFSAVTGAPSVRAVKDTLAEDSPYRSRPMRHLVLTFADPIRGPLILGAGRYRGLGLCLPVGEEAGP